MSNDSLLVVAGEASGDLHGARLIAEIRRLVPDLECFGLGGDEMSRAGFDAIAHSKEISVVGFTEVFKILPRARQLFYGLLAEAERRRPRGAVLIDFPEFNLRLARRLNEMGVPVVYYISPQIWAWRQGRVRTIAKRVAKMLVLFGFEMDFYRGHDVEVVHVGHPLVDEVPVLERGQEGAIDNGPRRIAVLPGSRDSEVSALLPSIIRGLENLAERFDLAVRLIKAPTVSADVIHGILDASVLNVELVEGDRFRVITDSDLALCASGTATLEVGLLGTPMIVLYRVGFWTYLLGRMLIRVPHIALVNLVLGERAVPELVQGDANPEAIARESDRLLSDRSAREAMRRSLAEVRRRLGRSGASGRAAEEIVAELLTPAHPGPEAMGS